MRRRHFRYSILVIILAIIISLSWSFKLAEQNVNNLNAGAGAALLGISQNELNEMDEELDKSESNLLIFIGVSFVVFIFLRTIENNGEYEEVLIDEEEDEYANDVEENNTDGILKIVCFVLAFLLIFFISFIVYTIFIIRKI